MWIGFLLLLPFMVPVTRAAENDIVVPANKHLFIGGVKFDALTITPGSGERILVNGVRLIDREEPQAPAIGGTREVQYSSEDVARYENVPAVKQLVESGTSVHDAVGICMQFELAFLDSLRETIAKGTFRLAEAQEIAQSEAYGRFVSGINADGERVSVEFLSAPGARFLASTDHCQWRTASVVELENRLLTDIRRFCADEAAMTWVLIIGKSGDRVLLGGTAAEDALRQIAFARDQGRVTEGPCHPQYLMEFVK